MIRKTLCKKKVTSINVKLKLKVDLFLFFFQNSTIYDLSNYIFLSSSFQFMKQYVQQFYLELKYKLQLVKFEKQIPEVTRNSSDM
jgi:hypothetical protein